MTQNSQELVYELIRENKNLILSIQEGEAIIADLKLELIKLENGQIELIVKLENATDEISDLTVKLQDANNEVGRLSMVVRRQIATEDFLKRRPALMRDSAPC